MKIKFQVADCKLQVDRRHQWGSPTCNLQISTCNLRRAFTLIELLVVISIIALLAALAVPAIKNIGAAGTTAGAARQLLDDVGRARQLAISQGTTVYMVFVPTNFWGSLPSSTPVINLVDKQLTGYNFISYGKVGDQPGQHSWHYLTDWQSLPQGTFIAAAKFLPQNKSLSIPQWTTDYSGQIDNWRAGQTQVYGFATNAMPFPTETSGNVLMPSIAFDYQGRLISEVDNNGNYHHAYIPLAQGTVGYGYNSTTKSLTLTPVTATGITETPPGNSTSISYNIIDIDPQTGRATWQHYKM